MAELSWQEVYDVVCRNGARPGADLCAVASADAESGRDPQVPPGDNGASHGLWQMEQGAGLGNGYSAAQLEDPDFAAAIMVPLFNRNYTAGIAAGYSGEDLVRWTCMATERPSGWVDEAHPGLESPAADRYARSWHDAVASLSGEEPPTMTYDPTAEPVRQQQSWTCSICTSTWMLNSLGNPVTAGEMQDRMVPALVTPDLGLLAGDGSALAPYLGGLTGLPATHRWADWAWLQAHAGQGPMGLGSGSLYHWVGLRRVNDDGSLALANPAPGYRGLWDTMTEAQFNEWAPWACVWLAVDPDEEDSLSQAERDELQRLRDAQPYFQTLLGTDDNPGGTIGQHLAQMEQAATGKQTTLALVVRGECAAIRREAGI